MENLHLSWNEVVNEIPYKTLLIMQKDKVQVVTGDVVVRTTGRAMAARRMAAMREKQGKTNTKTE